MESEDEREHLVRVSVRPAEQRVAVLVIGLSLLVGLVGVLASRVGLGHVAARAVDRDPHAYWLLGFVALVPAWLIVFSALLGPSPKARPEVVSAGSWILSTAVGLIGAILTEGLVRRADESETDLAPLVYWRLGVFGIAPAWAVAFLGYALKTIIVEEGAAGPLNLTVGWP